MRIVSWNIRSGGGRRAEAIARQLERWRPDVVVLQEFRGTLPSCWLASALRDQGLAHQRATVDPARPAANALLVASRWPFRPVRSRRAPAEPGRWLLLRVAAPLPFCLGAMHIPNMVSGRKYQYHDAVLDLARAWRRGPALLIGDTNTGRIGLDEQVPCFGLREERWMTALEAAGWRDSFRALHGRARAYTWYSPNAGNGFRLDEAFVHRSLLPRLRGTRYAWGRSREAPARRDALSDHAALIAGFAP